MNKQISCLLRGEGLSWTSGPQTATKWADVQQIASGASCSTDVISPSLVIICRSVGCEIQIQPSEGSNRRTFWTRYKINCACSTREGCTKNNPLTHSKIKKACKNKQEVRSSSCLEDSQTAWTAAAGPLRAGNLLCGDSPEILPFFLLLFLFLFCQCHDV